MASPPEYRIAIAASEATRKLSQCMDPQSPCDDRRNRSIERVDPGPEPKGNTAKGYVAETI